MASIGKQRRARLSKAQRRQRRRQQTRKTRAGRRRLRQVQAQLPPRARTLFDTLGQAFTPATALRFSLLLGAALLPVGRHTVANLLRTLGPLVPGEASSYRRVFSHRRWSSWRLAHLLTDWVLAHLLPDGPILLAGDDTVAEHPGEPVYGKGRHRDPVRSTHSYTAFRWGHKWVVLAVLVRFPFTRRLWALPVLVALYRSEEENHRLGRRHKAPPELLRQLLCVWLHWFPQRQFVCAAAGTYAPHALAQRAARHAPRLTYRSHFSADATLYEPAPPVVGKKPAGRPRTKGRKLPTPAAVVQQAPPRQRLNVAWYGGGRRNGAVVTGPAPWDHAGRPGGRGLWGCGECGAGPR